MKKTVLLLVLALALACSAALADNTVVTTQKGYWKDGALAGVPFGITESEEFSLFDDTLIFVKFDFARSWDISRESAKKTS